MKHNQAHDEWSDLLHPSLPRIALSEMLRVSQTLATCSIVTTTRSPLETRSMAPPMPFTILPWRSGNAARISVGGAVAAYADAWHMRRTHRDDPVGQVALFADFHGAQDRQADATTVHDARKTLAGVQSQFRPPALVRILERDVRADHAERVVAGKQCRAGDQGHRLLARVDQVGVLLAGFRVRALSKPAYRSTRSMSTLARFTIPSVQGGLRGPGSRSRFASGRRCRQGCSCSRAWACRCPS